MKRLVYILIALMTLGLLVSGCYTAPPLEQSQSRFPEDGSVGQPFDEETLEGVGALPGVTRVHFIDDGDGWYTIMPFRGDFGGDPYLDDGWIMNVYMDREGMAGLYIIVHESDPRWSEDLEPIWGKWAIFQEIHAGR